MKSKVILILVTLSFYSCHSSFQHLNRGLIKEKEGDFEGAIIDYTKAIEVDPNNAQAYFNRGNVKRGLLTLFFQCLLPPHVVKCE